MAHFVDTNVAVYCFADDPKKQRALEVLKGAVISVQVLNELTNVLKRKWRRDWREVDLRIAQVTSASSALVSIDERTHVVGRDLCERYGLAIYDGFIVSAALLAQCETLYSEDMQHGLVIEGVLTIRNPFV